MFSSVFFRKVKRFIFERIIGRIFFQRHRDSLTKNGPWFDWIKSINQKLNESGAQAPWVMSKEDCHAFWGGMTNDTKSTGNLPERYAKKSDGIIHFLHDFLRPQAGFNDSITELGCNVGANLYYLSQLGYQKLGGVEISRNALDQMDIFFPGLSAKLDLKHGDMRDILNDCGDHSVDFLFTIGVSMHVHPKDNFIFREMTRVAKKGVCTIEPETANSNYVFARNYRRVFEKLGFVQLKSVLITSKAYPEVPNPGLTARLFVPVANSNS